MTSIALVGVLVLLGLVLVEIRKTNRRLAEFTETFRVPFGADSGQESWLWYRLNDVRDSLVTILRRTSYLREVRNSLTVLQVYANKLHPDVDLDGYVIDRLAELERLRDYDTPLGEKDEQLYKMLQPHVKTWRNDASGDEWDDAYNDPVTPLFWSEIKQSGEEEV